MSSGLTIRSLTCGRYSYDDEILEWMMARFDGNLVVTAQDLQNYGLSLIQKEDPSFKASSGWALR